MDQWGQALQDPGVRSALLSFGLNMLQAPSAGNGPAGQFARSIGAAGETVTRREEADQAERTTNAKLAATNEGLRLNRQRVGISQQNANTRQEALDLRRSGGGLTSQQMLRNQMAENRNIEAKAKWEAGQIFKQVNEAELYGSGIPAGHPLEKYKGKTAGDIYRDLLSDQNWRKSAVLSSQQATAATIPAPEQRVVGRTYQTPKGPMVWQGNGWSPAQAAPELGDTSSATDDTEE